MKIALISDIHSNWTFFEEVLPKIEEHHPDQIYCLGDLVGYYDEPNQVIESIRAKGILCVKGNHDKYLLEETPYSSEKEDFYRVQLTRAELTEENLAFLKQLPDERRVELCGLNFYFTHSLPEDPVSYCYDPKKLPREFIKNIDFYCLGHTHIPLATSHFGTWVVNPGSIGQPRDHTQKSSFAVIDLKEMSIRLLSYRGPVESYQKKLKAMNFKKEVVQILSRRRND